MNIAAAVVRATTKVIALLRSLDACDAVLSNSQMKVIGMIGLANGDAPAYTLAQLSDCLVHESVHSPIYKLELGIPLCRDYNAACNNRIRSPWSGRRLDVHSFVHACFVWFALWSFWRSAASSTPGAEQYFEKAQRGFDKWGEIDREQLDSIVMPDVLLHIEAVADEVRSRAA